MFAGASYNVPCIRTTFAATNWQYPKKENENEHTDGILGHVKKGHSTGTCFSGSWVNDGFCSCRMSRYARITQFQSFSAKRTELSNIIDSKNKLYNRFNIKQVMLNNSLTDCYLSLVSIGNILCTSHSCWNYKTFFTVVINSLEML